MSPLLQTINKDYKDIFVMQKAPLYRALAFSLAILSAAPHTAFALRQSQLENQKERTGLEEALREASASAAPKVLTGRTFSMDEEEARRVLAWAVGLLPLEQGKDYLAFGQTRTPPNSPITLLAHLLPNTALLRKEVGVPGLKWAGHNVAVTRLLRSPAERNVAVPYTKEQMPWLLYRYHEDPDSREKWISVYRLLPGVSPDLVGRQNLFEQSSADPHAHAGEVLIDFPADLDAEPASNRHLSVLTPSEKLIRDFLRKSVSLAKAQSLAEYPGRATFPLAGGGLNAFWSELKKTGVKVAVNLQDGLTKAQEAKEWTHLVLHRVVRQRPKVGMTHFLVQGTLGRQNGAGGWVESPLEFIILLASNHPQWSREPVALRPLLGLWALGLIDASEIARSERVVRVWPNKVTREQLQRRAERPTANPRPAPGSPANVVQEHRFDSGYHWVVQIPIKGYVAASGGEGSPLQKLLGFRTPNRALREMKGWRSTLSLAMARGKGDPVQQPLAFDEDDSGDKWVGVWSPGTLTSYYDPQLWIRVSRGDSIRPGVLELKRAFKARQLAGMTEAAKKYLRGEQPVGEYPIRIRMSTGPSHLLNTRGRFEARLWGLRGGHGMAGSTAAVLSAEDLPPLRLRANSSSCPSLGLGSLPCGRTCVRWGIRKIRIPVLSSIFGWMTASTRCGSTSFLRS